MLQRQHQAHQKQENEVNSKNKLSPSRIILLLVSVSAYEFIAILCDMIGMRCGGEGGVGGHGRDGRVGRNMAIFVTIMVCIVNILI